MNWKSIETAPRDGTIILTEYGLCRYVKDFITEGGSKITGFYLCFGEDGSLIYEYNDYNYTESYYDADDAKFWTEFNPPAKQEKVLCFVCF